MIELLEQFGQIWAENFGIKILQDTFFLGIIFFTLFWLKNANARTKYIIAMIGIVKLLLPPFLPISLLSKYFNFSNTMIDVQIGTPMISASTNQVEPTLNLSLIGLCFVTWLCVVILSVLIPIFSTLRLKFKLRKAKPIRLSEIKDSTIKICQSDQINMPLTLGLFSNKIFVPARWDSWPADCRTMILQHEIAHIKRRDSIFKLVQMVAQALYFFHPLVWILNSRINQYREMACDDASVATKRNSNLEYSRYLVKIAEEMTQTEPGYSSASALIRQRNELLNRVQYQIMEVAMKHISKKKLGATLVVLFLSFSLLSFSFISNPPSSDKPGKAAVQEKAKIIGTIKDVKTGKPIEGAEVRIEGMDLAAVSDAEGNYSIAIADFTPGTYQIKASKSGYKFVRIATVKVEENITTRLDFTLGPTGGYSRMEKQAPSDKGKIVKVQELQKGVEIPPPPKEKLVTIEEQQYRKQETLTIKEKQPGEIPPPQLLPVKEASAGRDTSKIKKQYLAQTAAVKDREPLADYNTPPEVVGGIGELAKAIKYPESAKKAGITGTVYVGIQIDEQGKVQETKILESLNADCDQAAVDALKSVNWKPAMKDKKPVKGWVTVPVKFALK